MASAEPLSEGPRQISVGSLSSCLKSTLGTFDGTSPLFGELLGSDLGLGRLGLEGAELPVGLDGFLGGLDLGNTKSLELAGDWHSDRRSYAGHREGDYSHGLSKSKKTNLGDTRVTRHIELDDALVEGQGRGQVINYILIGQTVRAEANPLENRILTEDTRKFDDAVLGQDCLIQVRHVTIKVVLIIACQLQVGNGTVVLQCPKQSS